MPKVNHDAVQQRISRDSQIAEIAKSMLDVENLEPRGRDSLDFHEIFAPLLKDALAAAFDAGVQYVNNQLMDDGK